MKVNDKTRGELSRFYTAQDAASTALALYLQGVLDALGVERDRYLGIDDETGELLLRDPEPTE